MQFHLLHVPITSSSDRGVLTSEECYRVILDNVKVADGQGWDTVWFAEHHFDDYGGAFPSPALIALAAACCTKRIRVGAGIAVLPLNSALHLAEQYAMVDILSGGRLEMGVGRGFMPHEYRAMNVPFEQRASRFNEGLEVLRKAWNEERFSLSGEHYNLVDVTVNPRPLQRPYPPLWVAASTTRETFVTAGRAGLNLMINPYTRTEEELRNGLGWYFDAWTQPAFEPAKKPRVMAHQHLFCSDSERCAETTPREPLLRYLAYLERAYARGGAQKPIAPLEYDDMYPHRVMFGTAEVLCDKVRHWSEFGITDLCLMSHFGSISPEIAQASTTLFSQAVMPHFAAEPV